MTEDEMVGWDHRLNGHKFVQIPGDGDGQGSLACCSPWGRRVRHYLATEREDSFQKIMEDLTMQSSFEKQKQPPR